MVVLKTVLKVEISCEKCKRMLLMAISGLEGIDKIEVDTGKGDIIVTGDADPIEIICRARKTGKFVEVVSIGPPPKPEEKEEEKKDEKEEKKDEKKDDKKPDEKLPPCCRSCEQITQYILHVEPNWDIVPLRGNPSATDTRKPFEDCRVLHFHKDDALYGNDHILAQWLDKGFRRAIFSTIAT